MARAEGPPPARRALLPALAVVLIGLPFLSIPGRYIADTHDVLWFDPGWYLRNSLTLWKSNPFLQGQPNLDVMASAVGLFRALGLPVWAAERLWYGLLLFAGAAGVVLLTEHLRGRRSLAAPAVAALLYVLTPYTFGYGLLFSAVYLPYALLPWLVLAVARGIERPGPTGPALVGLVTFAMGGGNGAPQAYALLLPAAYIVWVTIVERRVSWRRAATFAAWSMAFIIGLNAYWIISLSSRNVANALAFSEQPGTINASSSYSESIRGLGFWQFYGGDASGPFVPLAVRYVTSPLWILAGFAVPVGAFLSAWLSRWRLRLLFLVAAILSVVGMAGIFPVVSPTPFGRALLFAYARIPGAAGLRTTYKLGGILNLSLAVLAAAGLEEALAWARRRNRGLGWRPALAGVAAVVIALNSFPLWSGTYRGIRSTRAVPRYWARALDFLQEHGGRTFFGPGTLFPSYRWGGLMEGVTQLRPGIDAVIPWAFPVNERYRSNLLAATERSYQEGSPTRGAAALFRLLGARTVVLQNDLDWARSQTARPAEMQRLAADPSLRPLAAFGAPGTNTAGSTEPDAPDAGISAQERRLPPVQILEVPAAAPAVRVQAGGPVVVSGDGDGLANLAGLGYLDDPRRPVLYSGSLSPAGVASLWRSDAPPSFVVTDTNRRRAQTFSAVRDNRSYTLPPGSRPDDRPIGYGLFGDRQEAQSVAVYPGVRSITASGDAGPAGRAQPEFQPAFAFDGDPRTRWLIDPSQDPRGRWIQEDLGRPLSVSTIGLEVPPEQTGRRIDRVRLSFSQGPPVVARIGAGRSTVSFPARLTTRVRLTVESVAGIGSNPVGLADVTIPGVQARVAVRVPTDLMILARRSAAAMDAVARSDLAYVFERAASGSTLSPQEEVGIDRIFDVPSHRAFVLSGTGHLDPLASDPQIDDLVGGRGPVQARGSSRLFGNPELRGSAALDGDPATAWVPAGSVGQWLRVRFPPHAVGRIALQAQNQPGRTPVDRVRLDFSDGSSLERTVDIRTGRVAATFRPRRVSSVTITIEAVAFAGQGQPPPVGLSEVRIPGVSPLTVRGAARLRCIRGRYLSVDGRAIPIRIGGTVSSLLSGGTAAIRPCDGRALALEPGSHEVIASGPVGPDTLSLVSRVSNTYIAQGPPPAELIRVRPARAGGLTVDVHGGSRPFLLSTGQDYDPGWTATVGARSLGPPLVVNGSSVGWRITQRGSFAVSVRYGPQHRYDAALALSALALLCCIAVLLVGRRRGNGRRREGRAPAERWPEPNPGERRAQDEGRPPAEIGLLLAFAALMFAFGGIYGLVIAAIIGGARWAGAPRSVLWAGAAACLVAAPLALMAQGLPRTPVVGAGFGTDHLVAHVLVGVAMALAGFAAFWELTTRRRPSGATPRSSTSPPPEAPGPAPGTEGTASSAGRRRRR